MTDIGAPMGEIIGDGSASGEPTAPVGNENGESQAPGINPAWKDMLDLIPSSLHAGVIPHLQKWDSNFDTKTSEVQSRYSPYESLIDSKTDPSRIENALAMADLMDTDPRKFYDEMGKFYKDQWGQGQEGEQEELDDSSTFNVGDEDEYDITQNPKFKELMASQETMAQYLAQQVQDQRLKDAEKEIDAEVATLTQKYGEFDENWVFSLALQQNMPLEDAVKAYSEFVDKIKGTPRPGTTAPKVFNSTGGTPSSAIDPANLSSKETRDLVADFVRSQNQE